MDQHGIAVPGAVKELDSLRISTPIIETDYGSLNSYMAEPVTDAVLPSLVVLHEAFGMVEHTRDLARRFASQGYRVLAPDLYSRDGGPDPSDMSSVLQSMYGIADKQVVADVAACASWLRAGSGASGRVGCIGFCSGGRQTLLAACETPSFDAAVDCWGGSIDRATPEEVRTDARPVPVIDLLEGLHCPMFIVGGAEDQNPSPAVLGQLVERTGQLNRTVVVKIFGGAGHAFLADYRPTYRPAPAHELWGDLSAFFRRHLADGQAS